MNLFWSILFGVAIGCVAAKMPDLGLLGAGIAAAGWFIGKGLEGKK